MENNRLNGKANNNKWPFDGGSRNRPRFTNMTRANEPKFLSLTKITDLLFITIYYNNHIEKSFSCWNSRKIKLLD